MNVVYFILIGGITGAVFRRQIAHIQILSPLCLGLLLYVLFVLGTSLHLEEINFMLFFNAALLALGGIATGVLLLFCIRYFYK